MELKLLSFEAILEIHNTVLSESGGLVGTPHPEYIHSAVARPQRFMSYDEDCDLHLVCALILDAMARNHSFADGNKRTALLSMLMTYRQNGVYLKKSLATNEKFEQLVLWVVKDKPEIQAIRSRLKILVEEFKM